MNSTLSFMAPQRVCFQFQVGLCFAVFTLCECQAELCVLGLWRLVAIVVLLILNLWCPGTGRLDGMHCVLHDGKVNPGC
jgi:hypothetical protein